MAVIPAFYIEAYKPVDFVGDPGVTVELWEDGTTKLTKDHWTGRRGTYDNQVDPALHTYYIQVVEDASPDPYALRCLEAAYQSEPAYNLFPDWNLQDKPYEPDDSHKNVNIIYVGNTLNHCLNRYAAASEEDWAKISWEDPPVTEELLKIDGESAGSTPWEFDSLTQDGSCVFELDASAKLFDSYGYSATYDGSYTNCYGKKAIAAQDECTLMVKFKIDSGIQASAASRLYLFGLECTTTPSVLTMITVLFAGTDPYLPDSWDVYNRGPGFFNSSQNFTVGDWHTWEVYFKRGTGADGGFIHKIDGIEIYNTLTLDLGPYQAEQVDVGSSGQAGVIPLAGDYVYFDEVILTIPATAGGGKKAKQTAARSLLLHSF